MKIGMVFPGQGSQSVGMLAAYAGLPGVDEVRRQAAAVLGDAFVRLLDDGPAEALAQTVNTQPAMVTAGYAAYRAWRDLDGPMPRVVAGHSLGEYTALVAAGSLTFADCLPLVRFRAEAMQAAVPEGQGAMAAILGLEDSAAREACQDAARGQVVDAVNFNAPGQVVIAGHREAVLRAVDACKARGAKRAMALPVSAPFHSALMQPAAERLREYLQTVALQRPGVDLVNNVDVEIVAEPSAIADALVRQAAAPVRWVEVVQRMAASGVTHILECGPGKVLTALVKRVSPGVQAISLHDRSSIDQALLTVGRT